MKLLVDFLEDPGPWNSHLKSYSSGVVLGIGFGMTVSLAHDRMPQMLHNTQTLGEDVGEVRHR